MYPISPPSITNTAALVTFRENIGIVQNGLIAAIEKGLIKSTLKDCTLRHFFTPIDAKFNCYTYAREMTIPIDTFIIGKLHRHAHLNIISQGSVAVVTEHGLKEFKAPCTFISEVGTKRAVHAKEGTIWTTIHTVSYGSEKDLDKIEAEVIAPSYEDLNLISTIKEFNMRKASKAIEGGVA